MQVLLLLLDARGSVVTRTTLFDEIWAGAVVGDDSLNRAVAKVRKVLEDTAPGLCEIETIPRTGYRLSGSLFDDPPPEQSDGSGAVARSEPSRRVVIAGLAATAAAGVAAWRYISSRPDPRFTQLVDRADQVLRLSLLNASVTASGLLSEAIRIEPKSARAWGLLAYAKANMADDIPASPTVITETEDAIRTALKLDPREANAMLARYMIKNSLQDWVETDRHLREILQIDPRNTFAMSRLVAMLQSAGLNEESWDWNERAITIDPVAPGHQFRKALKYWIFGRIQNADATADRLMRLWPRHAWVWNARFLIYAFTGRTGAALQILNDDQIRPKTINARAITTWRLSLAALADRSPANIAAARDSIVAGAGAGPGLAAYGGMILSELGELDAAFDVINGVLLARGNIIQRRPDNASGFTSIAGWRATQWLFTPPMAKLHADSRFLPLCDGIGLSDYWAKRGVKPSYLLQRR